MNKLDGDIAVERLNSAVGAFLDIVTEPEGVMVPVPERAPQPSLAERVKQHLKPSTDKAQGFAEEAKQAAIEAWKAADAAGSAVQVDVFTKSGTWTKPTGAKAINFLLIGGGGGGCKGLAGNHGTSTKGGRGGHGAGMVEMLIPAGDIPDGNHAVIVGKGGSPSTSATPTAGNHSTLQIGGFGSISASGAGGANGGIGTVNGADSGIPSVAYEVNGVSGSGCPAGAAGGFIYLSAWKAGARGSTSRRYYGGSTASGNATVEGGDATQPSVISPVYLMHYPGPSGGGGASSTVGNGGNGAKGDYGAGGGGGGAAWLPYEGGLGGAGGDGIVVITTFM